MSQPAFQYHWPIGQRFKVFLTAMNLELLTSPQIHEACTAFCFQNEVFLSVELSSFSAADILENKNHIYYLPGYPSY